MSDDAARPEAITEEEVEEALARAADETDVAWYGLICRALLQRNVELSAALERVRVVEDALKGLLDAVSPVVRTVEALSERERVSLPAWANIKAKAEIARTALTPKSEGQPQ